MKVIKINSENVKLLEEFISNLVEEKKQFRYYNTRDISVIKNHIVTLIYQDKNKLLCYGHLDFDGDKVWLGICTSYKEHNKGYGLKMMNELIKVATKKRLKIIYLTVDNNNIIAKRLYEKVGFISDLVLESNTRYKIEL